MLRFGPLAGGLCRRRQFGRFVIRLLGIAAKGGVARHLHDVRCGFRGLAFGRCRRFGAVGSCERTQFRIFGAFVVIGRRQRFLVPTGGIVGGRFGVLAAPDRVAARSRMVAVVAMPPRTAIDLVIGGALGALFLVDQGLPVGNRDLVVVGMDFAERQKTVAIAAVVDKSGL